MLFTSPRLRVAFNFVRALILPSYLLFLFGCSKDELKESTPNYAMLGNTVAELRGTLKRSNENSVAVSFFERNEVVAQPLRASNLREFITFPDLHELDLSNCGLSDKDVPTIVLGTQLRRLSLRGNALTAKSCEVLGKMPSLIAIDISYNPIGDQGITKLAANRNLELLSAAGTGISDKGMDAVAGLTYLRSLNVSRNPSISELGLRKLAGIRLERIDLSYLPIDGKIFDHLPFAESLLQIKMNKTAFNDADAERVAKKTPSLSLILLDQTPISDKSIESFSVLKCLEAISVSRTQLTDSSVAAFMKMPKLRFLDVFETMITEKAKAELAERGITFQPLSYFPGNDAVNVW